MAKGMWIVGILLAAVGVALGLMVFFSPASVVGWGVTAGTAVDLLVGGILAIGLGGVIDALHGVTTSRRAEIASSSASSIPELGRAAMVPAAAAVVVEPLSAATKETIDALEKATDELKQAFDDKPAVAVAAEETRVEELIEPESEPEPELQPEITAEPDPEPDPVAADEPEADDQLYVVEERTIRGRPARILSDGTVEAETDEGWMRFENLEHLNEYLDAMAAGSG